MSFGLTSAGFVAPSSAELVTDLGAKYQAAVDPGLDLDPDQPIGQIIGIHAADLASAWEVIATIYNAINPAAAEGQLLANLATLSGTKPQVATYSTVPAQLNLNATTTVHAGAIASVAGQPGNTWVLTADVTSTTAGIYNCTFRSSLPGPFAANIGTLTVIGTPTTGWNAVVNTANSLSGLAADTDTTLRQRRELELQGQGSGDIDAIRAAVVKAVSPYSSGNGNPVAVFVFENTALTTDVNGVPGKAFHVIIWDGITPQAAVTAAVAQAIWNQKPTGIQSYGATSAPATDSQGNTQTVFFDRATQKVLYVRCTTTPSTLTTAQTAAVKSAIANFIATNVGLGAGIIARAFSACPLEPTATYTPFVTDVPVFQFDIVASPTNTGNLAGSQLSIYTSVVTNVLVNGI
jgi:hypothetical protein